MDFNKVLPLIIGEFEKQGVRYALMGGFSIGVMGIMRSTMDLDFLLNAQDIPKISEIMEKYGYKCVYKSENVAQYVSGVKIFGEIDFVFALRKVSLSMLERAKEQVVLEGNCRIKVLIPEDVIGLKLQALVNDPSRENREYADMGSIMERFGSKLNWNTIEEYFTLFEKNNKFKELKKTYANPA